VGHIEIQNALHQINPEECDLDMENNNDISDLNTD